MAFYCCCNRSPQISCGLKRQVFIILQVSGLSRCHAADIGHWQVAFLLEDSPGVGGGENLPDSHRVVAELSSPGGSRSHVYWLTVSVAACPPSFSCFPERSQWPLPGPGMWAVRLSAITSVRAPLMVSGASDFPFHYSFPSSWESSVLLRAPVIRCVHPDIPQSPTHPRWLPQPRQKNAFCHHEP